MMRSFLYGQHIIFKDCHNSTVYAVLIIWIAARTAFGVLAVFQYLFPCLSKHTCFNIKVFGICVEILTFLVIILRSVIKTDSAVVIHYRRVKADIFHHHRTVGIFNVSEIFKRSCGLVAHSNADRTAVTAIAVFSCHTVV